MTDLDVLRKLENQSTDISYELSLQNAYYDGQIRLASIGLSLPPEMRQLATVINWPRLVVDSLEERLDIEGFRIAGHHDLDDRLWDWWEKNDLSNESGLAHVEALVHGRSFITVGLDEDDPDTPIISVESSRSMTAIINPRTRKVEAALRLYEPDERGQAGKATLYMPDVTRFYVRGPYGWSGDPDYDDIEHGLGEVLVVPLVNRARISDRLGRSEMVDVAPLTDAACRSLTNLQGAQELLAVPQRYVMGAVAEDFKDKDGNVKTPWEVYLGRYLALGDPEAKVGQFSAADLRNFTETVNFYARHVAAIAGLPPHAVGITSDNPASADAIRSAENRLIKRAERRQVAFAGGWEKALRLAIRLIDGVETADRLETKWRNPATPTLGQTADAVVKLFQQKLIPRSAAWDALGYSAEQQKQYAAQMDEEDPMDKLMRSVGANGAVGIPGGPGPGVAEPVGASPAVPGAVAG